MRHSINGHNSTNRLQKVSPNPTEIGCRKKQRKKGTVLDRSLFSTYIYVVLMESD
jgi:hypothetical protein